jgi:polyhydroxybutyrate depolymerase
MNTPFKRTIAIILLLLALSIAVVVQAQDATAEPSPDATAEIIPESTAEATPEATAEPLPSFPGTGSYTVHQELNGLERLYRITIPKIYDETADPVPLVIVLHGAGGTGNGIESFSGFDALAEQEGFIVIYPDGLNNVWNDGRPADPRVGDQNDVGFLGSAVKFLLQSLNIDSNRVYVTGYSMGGMLSYKMACDLPNMIAAAASVASTFPQYLAADCVSTAPVPLLVLQGTDDPVVPWIGVQGGYFSAAQTLKYWALHNDCQTDQGITMLDDTAPDDGTRVIVEGFTDCTSNADVQVDSIFHGGHTWPGHPIQAPFDLGATSMDLDAPLVIWDFFQKHPRVETAN